MKNIFNFFNKKIFIYGAGGMALVVAETASLLGYKILGFIDDTSNAPTNVNGINVFKTLPSNNNFKVIIAIGNCKARLSIAQKLKKENRQFATLIHPSAIISKTAKIGEGVFIAAGAIIDPNVKIGNYCIINTNSIISHGSKIGEACHFAPQSAIAGDCIFGNAVWLGIGAKVIEKKIIGSNSFIGAGSIVIKNMNSDMLIYGIPAKEIKSI